MEKLNVYECYGDYAMYVIAAEDKEHAEEIFADEWGSEPQYVELLKGVTAEREPGVLVQFSA